MEVKIHYLTDTKHRFVEAVLEMMVCSLSGKRLSAKTKTNKRGKLRELVYHLPKDAETLADTFVDLAHGILRDSGYSLVLDKANHEKEQEKQVGRQVSC